MITLCRKVNCDKTFSSTPNLIKHEKSKGHRPKDAFRPILFGASRQVYTSPTPICSTSPKYKYNIVEHLKSCYEICKKRKGHIDSKDYKVRKNIYKEI